MESRLAAARLAALPSERIAWISMGTFRYLPDLKDRMERRPRLYDEFVRSTDGIYRYTQRVRTRMYRTMRKALREATGAPVYMCMESAAVWHRVYGEMPCRITEPRRLCR